jgi:hypothetical protein
MPWTIPNLLLHDGRCRCQTQRSLGFKKVWVYCSNPDCHHNADLDVEHLPDEVTFNDLQPGMVCTACGHRGADVRTT